MSKRHFIIPIFVPHTGCPNDCIFCNQRKITGKSTDMTKEDILSIIEEHLKTIPSENRTLEIAFFGGSFTGIDLKVQAEFLEVALEYKRRSIVDKIRVSTRPDYIDRERLDLLKVKGVDIIELGVQSMDDKVLKASYRGHTAKDVENASRLIKEYGFTLGLQMMVGLPLDTRAKTFKTVKSIVSLAPDIARIYPTLVIKDTELEREFLKGSFVPLSLEEAVYRSKIALFLLERAGIKVIRVGLQPSDNITEGRDIVSGPFHPSFRQLVLSEIYYDVLEYVFEKFKDNREKSVTLKVNSSKVSNVSGQKGKNKKRLKEKFEFKNIKIISDNMDSDIINIDSENWSANISISEVLEDIYVCKLKEECEG